MTKRNTYFAIFTVIVLITVLLVALFIYKDINQREKIRAAFNSLTAGMHISEVKQVVGEYRYQIKLVKGYINYYKGPSVHSDYISNEKLITLNNQVVKQSQIVEEYGYYELLFDDADRLKIQVHCGEMTEYQTEYGVIKGSSIKSYFQKHRQYTYDELQMNISTENDVYNNYGEPDRILSSTGEFKIYLYAPINFIEYNNISSDYFSDKKMDEFLITLSNKKYYYAFCFNKQGYLIIKEDQGRGISKSIINKRIAELELN